MKALKHILLTLSLGISLVVFQGCYTTFGTISTVDTSPAKTTSPSSYGDGQYAESYDNSYVETDTIYEDYDGSRTVINNFYINNPDWRPYFDPFWDEPFYWNRSSVSVWVGIDVWDPYWWDPYYYGYYPPVIVVTPWRPWRGWWRYPTVVYWYPWYWAPWYWDPYYSGWGWGWYSGPDEHYKRRDWERRHPVVNRGDDYTVPARGGTGIRKPHTPAKNDHTVRARTVHRRQIQVRDRRERHTRSERKIVRRGNRTRYSNASNGKSTSRVRQIIRRVRRVLHPDRQSPRSSDSGRKQIIHRRSSRDSGDSGRKSRSSSRVTRSRNSDGGHSGSSSRSYRSHSSRSSGHSSAPSYRSRGSSSRSSSSGRSSGHTRSHRSRRR